MRHRLENPGKVPLEIIEVQSGTYLGEDDIVRFDDNVRPLQLKCWRSVAKPFQCRCGVRKMIKSEDWLARLFDVALVVVGRGDRVADPL